MHTMKVKSKVWSSDVTRNRKLILYKNFKLEFSHEQYLDILNVRKFRHALAQLRTGNHALEMGRYNNTPRDQRLCKMCSFNIENEYHFVLCCNAYNDLRYIYLPKEHCKLLFVCFINYMGWRP